MIKKLINKLEYLFIVKPIIEKLSKICWVFTHKPRYAINNKIFIMESMNKGIITLHHYIGINNKLEQRIDIKSLSNKEIKQLYKRYEKERI